MCILKKYFGDQIVGRHRWHMFLILFLVTAGFNGFRYVNWPFGNSLFFISIILISFICFAKRKLYKNGNFSGIVILFVILPFFSIFNSFTLFNQSIWVGIRVNLSASLVWMLYYFLHIFKVKETTILYAMLYISLFIVTVQIIQQFTYPNALFGVYSEETMKAEGRNASASMRNGLWRFPIGINMYFTAPILFFLLISFLKNHKVTILMCIVLLYVSVYMTLTRQVIFAVFLTTVYAFFLGKRSQGIQLKMWHFALLFVFILILFLFRETLFGKLIEKTQSDANEDNIRLYAMSYFWDDSLKSVFTFLFGYGRAGNYGEFYNYCEKLHSFGFFVTDVGAIGMIWRYGFIYVLCSYYVLYKMFYILRKIVPVYIRLFIFFTAVMSIMIFPFGAHHIMTMIWPLLLYICDLHIYKSQFALKRT